MRVRAKFDLSDPKRIVIRELPFGSTTESLIASVEAAAKAGRIKIASISDFTTDKVEIEIRLQRGVYAEEVLPSLYAFTECEASISCNFLVIQEGLPVQTTVSEVLRYHSKRLLGILKSELQIEERELLDEIHARTLERIFIEERVYKAIENKKSQEGVTKAVIDGLSAYKKEIGREVTLEDVERLLKIPIRRISLYDIEKAKAEMDRLAAKLKEARHHLAHLTDYAVAYLSGLAKRLAPAWERKTELSGFTLVDVKEAAKRDLPLRYDGQSGYLGTNVSSGEARFEVSTFDKILIIRRSGIWSVVPAPERFFVDQGLLYCALADKDALADVVFSLVYRDGATGYPYLKRFRIEAWIQSKDYPLIPENSQILWFTSSGKATFTVKFEKKPRQRVSDEVFKIEDFDTKGIKANGVRLYAKPCASVEGPSEGSHELFSSSKAEKADRSERAEKVAGQAGRASSKGGLLAAAEARKASAVKPKAKAVASARKPSKAPAKAAKGEEKRGRKKKNG